MNRRIVIICASITVVAIVSLFVFLNQDSPSADRTEKTIRTNPDGLWGGVVEIPETNGTQNDSQFDD